MPVNPDLFANIVTKLRSMRGLSQRELGDLADLGNQTVSRIERGDGDKIKSNTAARILRALDKAHPLTQAERKVYMAASGLDEFDAALRAITDPHIDQAHLDIVYFADLADLQGSDRELVMLIGRALLRDNDPALRSKLHGAVSGLKPEDAAVRFTSAPDPNYPGRSVREIIPTAGRSQSPKNPSIIPRNATGKVPKNG